MAKLIYETSSGRLEFGNKAPLLVTKMDGLGSVRTGIRTQKSPRQDGVTVTDMALEPRFVTIEGQILEPDKYRQQEIREQMLRIFRPKTEAKLTLERYGTTRTITCVPEIAPEFPSAMQERVQSFFLSLICPDPYWQNIVESKTDISTETGNIEFPLEIPAEGLELSIRTISFITNIYNQGDVDTPIKARLKATGTVVNPIIENLDTGEYIRVKRELAEGDTLEINTAFGNKRVEIIKPDGSRENVFHYIDYKSTFFQLAGGDNTIKYDAEVGENNLDVSIYYTPNYLGI